jgi:hypothetical protein
MPEFLIKWQISKLWKQVFILDSKVKQLKSSPSPIFPNGHVYYEEARERTGKLINALLDYYYTPDDEREKEYVEGHRFNG